MLLFFCFAQETVVETPQNVPYQGKRIATTKIIGVSVLRAGETMEQALSEVPRSLFFFNDHRSLEQKPSSYLHSLMDVMRP